MKRRTTSAITWLGGGLVGLLAGVVLVSWLPLEFKLVLMAAIGIVLNLAGTPSSRAMQAAFLIMAGASAFIVLLVADTTASLVTVLAVAALAWGLLRAIFPVRRLSV